MKYFLLLSMFVSTFAMAHQSKCTIGRSGTGKQTLIIGGKVVEYYNSVSAVAEAFRLVKDAGACSDYYRSNCTIGRNGTGRQTVIVNGKIIEYYTSLSAAANALAELRDAGVCHDY